MGCSCKHLNAEISLSLSLSLYIYICIFFFCPLGARRGNQCSVLSCGLDSAGIESWRGQAAYLFFFLFFKMSRLAVGPTQPSFEWVLGFFPGIKQSGHDVDY